MASTTDSSTETDGYVSSGDYDRDTRYLSTRITEDGRDGYPVEPGRYRLVVARACPWANRAIIVRRLLGLEDVLSMGVCGPTHDERSWTFDLDPEGRDPVLDIERLQDAFLARDPHYDKGITVPAIVEIATGEVVTNDFEQITLDLSTEWRQHHRDGAPDLYPEHLRDEMDDVMERVYTEVNNGVYRCTPPPKKPTSGPTTGCSTRWTGWRTGCPTSATWSVSRSRRRTCVCSPPSPGSTPSTTATSNATGRN